MADLAAFLDRASRTRFAYGTFDCGLWLADWIVETGRPDPAAALRGTYADAVRCGEILGAAGGMHALVAGLAHRAALSATPRPAAGAIGTLLVPTRDGRQVAGAICTGPRWAILTEAGMMSAPADPISAWAV